MAQEPDQSSISSLFLAHSDQLRRYLCRRLRNHNDAQEVAQEAYLRLLRVNRRDYIRNPQAYLYRIARNLIHELYTGNSTGPVADNVDVDSLAATNETPEDATEYALRLRAIDKALSELSVKCRTVVLLFWHKGLNQREISGQLDISRSMVQKHLAHGIAHCRKRLARFGGQDGLSR